MRIGFGYDSHRLVAGRNLVLGGRSIPHEQGLLGHSDADALCHALALRHTDNRALRYLVPAVLPVYMLHQTVIVVVAHNLQPLRIPPLIEGPMLVVVTFACCFAGYEAVRRVGWLRPLFGLKPASRPDSPPRTLNATDAALPD